MAVYYLVEMKRHQLEDNYRHYAREAETNAALARTCREALMAHPNLRNDNPFDYGVLAERCAMHQRFARLDYRAMVEAREALVEFYRANA